MKFKKTIIASVAALALTGFITGCGDEKKTAAPALKDSRAVTLKVGVSPVPHAEILGAVKDKLAKEGNKKAIAFPRAKITDAPDDFSFSGLKSAVLNYLNQCQMKGEEVNRADVAASFQQSVTDVLTEHTVGAAKRLGINKVAIAGGVASNSSLRAQMEEACRKNGIEFYHPSPIFCTDNAAMIGVAGYYEYIKGIRDGWDLNAKPNLKIGER